MALRFAFAGFRHSHIQELYKLVQERSDTELAAACEEDAATRADRAKEGRIRITHESIAQMFDHVPCDVVAIGDYLAVEADAETVQRLNRDLRSEFARLKTPAPK